MRQFRCHSVFLACAIVGTVGSATGAQTPSAKRLLHDWQDSVSIARKKMRSYRVDGEFQSRKLPGLMEVVPPVLRATTAAYKPPLYKWIALRDENRFYWDVTDANFEWNPNRAPDINRSALSFDGARYYRLDLHNQMQPTPNGGWRGREIPRGVKVTPAYHQNTPPQYVNPITAGTRPRPSVTPQNPEFDRSTMEEGMHWFQGFPVEPWQILRDNFNCADKWGNLPTELQKRAAFLSVTVDTVEGIRSVRLDLPFREARSETWLPTSVWFRQEEGHWVPWRYYSTSNAVSSSGQAPRDDAESSRMVTVTQAQVSEGIWWPSRIKMVHSVYRDGRWIEIDEAIKTLRLTRLNDAFDLSEFQVAFPKYAAVAANGEWLPRENLPYPPPATSRLYWLQALLTGLVAASVAVMLALMWRRLRQYRQPTSP